MSSEIKTLEDVLKLAKKIREEKKVLNRKFAEAFKKSAYGRKLAEMKRKRKSYYNSAGVRIDKGLEKTPLGKKILKMRERRLELELNEESFDEWYEKTDLGKKLAEMRGKGKGCDKGGERLDGGGSDEGSLPSESGVSSQELGLDPEDFDFKWALDETVDKKVRLARERADAAGEPIEDLLEALDPRSPCSDDATFQAAFDKLWESYGVLLDEDVHRLLSKNQRFRMDLGVLRIYKRSLGEPCGFYDCLCDVLVTYYNNVTLFVDTLLM